MNEKEFINELKKLSVDITEQQLQLLNKYYEMLVDYNKHTNLTRIVSKEDVFLKHFYDSLTAIKVIDLKKIDNVVDLGSGAGFPGIVLKIFFPNLNVTVLDSNNKKTKFLSILVDKLNIKVNIVTDRAENYSKNNLNKYDLVVARAVAHLRILSEISFPLIKENGYFLAMKGKNTDEFNESIDTIDILKGEILKIDSFTLNCENGERNLVLIKKNKATKLSNLRTYDKIVKYPLLKISK